MIKLQLYREEYVVFKRNQATNVSENYVIFKGKYEKKTSFCKAFINQNDNSKFEKGKFNNYPSCLGLQ